MTQEEILEGNKLIALFMGDIEREDSKVSFKRGCPVNGLKYHSSWDWLMDVVEKIEKLEHIHVQIDYKICRIFNFKDNLITKIEGNSKLENTYLAVIAFINYYSKDGNFKH